MKKENPVILVTGSKGQVGQELQVLAKGFESLRFIFAGREELDVTDTDDSNAFFEKNKVTYCINCAAYTAVDKAESEPELARRINVDGVKNLAEACLENGAKLLHLSTDYVYHSDRNVPIVETDLTHPQSIYAQTKWEGDEIALQSKAMVIRTSWVYSSFGHNFVKTMLRFGAERKELNVVYDQIGTPSYARDLATALLTIIQKVETGKVERYLLSDLYHYSNEGVTSWYDFAKSIFLLAGMEVKVNPIETKDYPTPAKRPPFSVLNKEKIKATFGLEIPHWQESLMDCLETMGRLKPIGR